MFMTSLLHLMLMTAEMPYGEVYLEETSSRILPQIELSAGYAGNITNSFMHLHSMVGGAQYRVWKYISTGILGQYTFGTLSQSGEQIKKLEGIDIRTSMPHPEWGLFSQSQVQLMLGQWNVMNLMPLQVDLLLGGGIGMLRTRKDLNGAKKFEASHLWSVEQRLRFWEDAGILVSLFGHRGGVFLQTGLHVGFN